MPKTDSFTTRSEASSPGYDELPSKRLQSTTNHPKLKQEQNQLENLKQNFQASSIGSSRQKFGIIAEATKESYELKTAVATDEDQQIPTVVELTHQERLALLAESHNKNRAL